MHTLTSAANQKPNAQVSPQVAPPRIQLSPPTPTYNPPITIKGSSQTPPD